MSNTALEIKLFDALKRTDPDCYAHACEPNDLDKLKRAFEMIRELASSRVKSWCG